MAGRGENRAEGGDFRRRGPTSRGASGGRGGAPQQQQFTGGDNNEEELASRMLQIQSKRFYLDVKQNRRGRFIKIAEVGAGGQKNRIMMSMGVAAEFRDHLTQFGDLYASLGPPNPDALPEGGQIKSETISKERRRYYLDLKENNRGRFLRVAQSIQNGPRSVIVIPAQGIIECRDALTKLLEEFGTTDDDSELPEGKQFRVDNKVFYFDIGQNDRGVFMRISEVRTNVRSAITIPERSWKRFRDIFHEVCDKMETVSTEESGEVKPAESPNGAAPAEPTVAKTEEK